MDEKIRIALALADLYTTSHLVDLDVYYLMEYIAYINMELYVNSNMLYEYQTEFADAFTDPSSDL